MPRTLLNNIIQLCRSIVFAFIAVLCSCNHTTEDYALNRALELAGDNRKELEKVLLHFANDSLKLEAAKFLIRNMPGHYSYADTDLVNTYYNRVDSIINILQGSDKSLIAESINRIATEIGIERVSTIQDVNIISSNFLIENINEAFYEWQNGSWSKHLTFDDFCEYLLPYKVEELQPLDSWRRQYHNFQTDSLYELAYCDMFSNSSYKAAVVMNKNLSRIIKPFSWNILSCPIYRISTRMKIPFGRCDDYASLSAALFRSVGIPTSVEIIPHWAYRRLGYLSNAVYAGNGRSIMFNGLSEGPDVTQFVDEKCAKIYRRTYSINPIFYEYITSREYVPEPFSSPFQKDVTNEYIATATISPIIKVPCKGYVCLSIYGDNDWTPIAFSKINNKGVTFENVGKNVVYIVQKYLKNGTPIAVSEPFIVGHSSKLKYISPDTSQLQDIILQRKYPVIEYVHKYARLINEGEFEASNSPNFKNPVLIHKIDNGEAIGQRVVLSDTIPPFRYWRYIQRHRDAHCNIGEIYFIDKITHKRLYGKIIGTEGHRTIYKGMTRDKAFDNNLLTSFNSPNANGDWVGMDFGKKVNIGEIIYFGRSDGNMIEIGDTYDLLYWNQNKWSSLGRKTAEDVKLNYHNVPKGSLLLLRDITKGSDERIFMIDENGKQRWF